MRGDSFLVVRAGAERYGIALAAIEEVVNLAEPGPVPACLAAFRGVVRWRERHLSVLHLGALVEGTAAPAERGGAAVVMSLGGRHVALEVEEAEDVVEHGATSTGETVAEAAAGVWRVGALLVTMLEPAALAERLAGTEEAG